jgi:hypothetical protein
MEFTQKPSHNPVVASKTYFFLGLPFTYRGRWRRLRKNPYELRLAPIIDA